MKIYTYHFKDGTVQTVVSDSISLDNKINLITFGLKIKFVSLSGQTVKWLRSSSLHGQVSYPYQYEPTPVCVGSKVIEKNCETIDEIKASLRPSGKDFNIISVYNSTHWMGNANTTASAAKLINKLLGLNESSPDYIKV